MCYFLFIRLGNECAKQIPFLQELLGAKKQGASNGKTWMFSCCFSLSLAHDTSLCSSVSDILVLKIAFVSLAV